VKERLLFLFIDVLTAMLSRQLGKLREGQQMSRLDRFSAYADKRMQKRGVDTPSSPDISSS
jgi:hypothetical protein